MLLLAANVLICIRNRIVAFGRINVVKKTSNVSAVRPMELAALQEFAVTAIFLACSSLLQQIATGRILRS